MRFLFRESQFDDAVQRNTDYLVTGHFGPELFRPKVIRRGKRFDVFFFFFSLHNAIRPRGHSRHVALSSNPRMLIDKSKR